MTMQPIHAPLAFHPVPAVRHYDVFQVATAVGLSADRFRRVRRDWTVDRDFPAEINEPGEPIRYLAEAVDRWVQRRTQRVHAQAEAKAPPPVPPMAAQRGRDALRKIKGAAPC